MPIDHPVGAEEFYDHVRRINNFHYLAARLASRPALMRDCGPQIVFRPVVPEQLSEILEGLLPSISHLIHDAEEATITPEQSMHLDVVIDVHDLVEADVVAMLHHAYVAEEVAAS